MEDMERNQIENERTRGRKRERKSETSRNVYCVIYSECCEHYVSKYMRFLEKGSNNIIIRMIRVNNEFISILLANDNITFSCLYRSR